jgi:hypothetical protein
MNPKNIFKKNGMSKLLIPFFVCLTLGLAPHFPEPHIVEKLRWIFGGEKSLAFVDWFDVVLHGTPWLWLGYSIKKVFYAKT